MKALIAILIYILHFSPAGAQTKGHQESRPDPAKKLQTVEAACGECQFGMTGKSCDLAIRINNKTYFVDGTDIDSYGDAHAKDGFCKAIRKAEVQGEIVGDRYKVTYFRLLKSAPLVDSTARQKDR